jgi:hypothetical protein
VRSLAEDTFLIFQEGDSEWSAAPFTIPFLKNQKCILCQRSHSTL